MSLILKRFVARGSDGLEASIVGGRINIKLVHKVELELYSKPRLSIQLRFTPD